MNASGGSDLLSTALRLIIIPPAGSSYNVTAFVGAYRDASNPPWGWHWVDGSNATNLNCFVKGCSIWSGPEPTFVT